MKRTIEYLILDPEGNITILVTSPVEREDYQKVALALLDACPEAEQVGFVITGKTAAQAADHTLPYMEMSGLEFCGNATRGFAFYEARKSTPPRSEIDVAVSGCDHPLHAWIDAAGPQDADVRLQMPVPEETEDIRIPITSDPAQKLGRTQLEGQLVHLDGISHLIIRGIPADTLRNCGREDLETLFLQIRDCAYQTTGRDMPAFGVMFVDTAAARMMPVVYVRDVDTIYFEGSCASGSNAAAYALAMQDLAVSGNEKISYVLHQPAGTLRVDVEAAADAGGGIAVRQMLLSGHVGISNPHRLEINEERNEG